MSKIYDIKKVLKEMSDDEWFNTFMNECNMAAGVLRLKRGEKDPQSPHANDEIYYIIKGDGFIRIEGKDYPVKEGSVIFVPAGKKHNFHDNKEELIALYVFAGEDKDL